MILMEKLFILFKLQNLMLEMSSKLLEFVNHLKTNPDIFHRIRKVLTRHNDAVLKGVTDEYGNITCQDI